jgi:TonB family protein
VDGAPAGQTPATLDKLKPGPHQFELTAAGFEPWSRRVAVAAGKTARVEAQLVPVASPKPIARTTTPTPPPGPVEDPRVYASGDVDTPPKKISCKSPEYPKEATPLKSGQRASVTLSFVVLESGDLTDVQIVESAGGALDDAVTSAFRTCKYQPGMKQGVKKKVRLSQRFTFLGG